MSKQKDNNQMLGRLADALVEEILNTSDEDIIKEAEEDYGDPKKAAENARAVYHKARCLTGKRRLLEAKKELASQERKARTVINIEPSEARRKIDEILKNHPETAGEFTLAARKGKDLSDEDLLGILEDLQDLGLYNSDDDQG